MKIDDYGDENDQKQTNTMPFKSKYTPFRHNMERWKKIPEGPVGISFALLLECLKNELIHIKLKFVITIKI